MPKKQQQQETTLPHILLDPSVIFQLISLAVIPINLNMSPAEALTSVFLNPYLLAFIALQFCIFYFTRCGPSGACARISRFEAARANWYLFCNFFWHVFFDGLGTWFKFDKTADVIASGVDKRYGAAIGGVKNGASALHSVCLVELFVMGPGCAILYWAIHKGKRWRPTFEAAIAALQLMGTVVWILSDVLETRGASFEKIDASPRSLTYFWFGVFVGGLIWVLVPAWFIVYNCFYYESPTAEEIDAVEPCSPWMTFSFASGVLMSGDDKKITTTRDKNNKKKAISKKRAVSVSSSEASSF